jgi:hypothetical protein
MNGQQMHVTMFIEVSPVLEKLYIQQDFKFILLLHLLFLIVVYEMDLAWPCRGHPDAAETQWVTFAALDVFLTVLESLTFRLTLCNNL